MRALTLAFLFVFAAGAAAQPPAPPPLIQEPQTILLWPAGAPGALGQDDRDRPAVTVYMPPDTTGPMTAVIIAHTNADTVVPVENAVADFLALRKAGVPAEMHVFRNGPHGTGLAQQDPALAEWPRLLANWLRVSGFLK